MNGKIQVRHRSLVLTECDSFEEAMKYTQERGIADCQFVYAYEVAYLDEGNLMVDQTAPDDIQKEIRKMMKDGLE